jgi:anti-sigma factor RsiW
MTCERIAGRLSAYIDNQLPAWEKSLVADHTAGCLSCQAESAQLLAMKRAVRAERGPGLPDSLRAEILQATVEHSAGRGVSKIWWVPVFATAAIAAGWLVLSHLTPLPRAVPLQQARTRPHAPPHSVVAWRAPGRHPDSEINQ